MMSSASELRLYLVANTACQMNRMQLAQLSAEATWRVMSSARIITPEQAVAYDDNLQPKICLRVKSQSHLSRSVDEAYKIGLPVGIAELNGVPAVIAIGPVAREALPDFVRKLQIFDADLPDNDVAHPEVPDGNVLWIAVRKDIEIPAGKLAAQAGHGCWSAIRSVEKLNFSGLHDWHSDGCKIFVFTVQDLSALDKIHSLCAEAAISSSYIVDAGRTVFNQPTPTVVGFGPCDFGGLPKNIADAIIAIEPSPARELP